MSIASYQAMEQKTKTFKDLIIWQKSFVIFKMLCEDIGSWPKDPSARSVIYQILDSGGSMSANIAEGFGRGGPKEFEQFLRYSRGSLAETEDWLIKALHLKLISSERYIDYQKRFEEISKMTASFINKLRTQRKKT